MAQCKVMRRVTTHSYRFNMITGEKSEPVKNEPVSRECGIPTFGSALESQNVCRSCNEGWNSEDNYILNTSPNWILINESIQNVADRLDKSEWEHKPGAVQKLNEARRKFAAGEHFSFDTTQTDPK